MAAKDVSHTLSLALKNSELESVNVRYRPRLYRITVSRTCPQSSETGSMNTIWSHARATISSDDLGQNRASASLDKKQVLLENYYLPRDLKARIGEFIDYYNTERYHESLNNLPAEGKPFLIDVNASSRNRWSRGVSYTTNRKQHDPEPDERRASLTSDHTWSEIL